MDQSAKELLVEIGRQLDDSIFPNVRNGGFVVPSTTIVSLSQLGKEKYHAGRRKKSSPIESRPGPQSWYGASRESGTSGESGALGGPWAPGEASPVFYPIINSNPEPLSRICDYYPDTRIWEQSGGFWLLVKSSLLANIGRKATFLIAVSTKHGLVRGWAFWDSVVGQNWIGPRHTNFPDGSICGYEPSDGTWNVGDPIVNLLDIYSVWALRHLHLEVEGRWPGPQSVPQKYERLLELRDDELCGCGGPNLKYADCCKTSDLKANRVREAVKFGFFSAWSHRHPPDSIWRFITELKQPPELKTIFI